MSDFTLNSRAFPKGFKSLMLKKMLNNLPKIPKELAKVGKAINDEIKRNLSGRILQRRSSDLYNSWQWAVSAHNSGWRLIIGSDVVYARIHNFGGFAGRGHKTKIKKTRYVDKAVLKKKVAVRRIMRNYILRIAR